jgi:N-acetyl-gamma-glutamyl-phosphate reductase
MRPTVFIDGHVGTTGLRIRDWLAPRTDLELVVLPEAQRKDDAARRDATVRADVTILCLPDAAARTLADSLGADEGRLIDASTAHRVAQGWVFGLPELQPPQRDQIRHARRVANPGCYSTAFILLMRPLVDAGVVAPTVPLPIHALSGYSGGGKEMIARWEDSAGGLVGLPYEAPYALERVHKHVPEMVRYAGLEREPYFVPAVGPFRTGMRVEVPLHASVLAAGMTARKAWEALYDRYRGEHFVRVLPYPEPLVTTDHSFDPRQCNETNRIDLHVLPHPSGHALLVAILDNLGKGAAGAAIQNMNLMLGIDETSGLAA